MSKREFDEMMCAMYGAYVNIKRKRNQEPMPYHAFKVRFKMWKEW